LAAGSVSSDENGPKVGGDQRLVVRHDLGRVRGVGLDDQLDWVTEQPSRLVDVAGPEVIALLERLTVGGEVTRERQGDADLDGAQRVAS
jgi:hypothetical protein